MINIQPLDSLLADINPKDVRYAVYSGTDLHWKNGDHTFLGRVFGDYRRLERAETMLEVAKGWGYRLVDRIAVIDMSKSKYGNVVGFISD